MDFAVRPAAAADVSAMHRIRASVRQNRLTDPRIDESSYAPYIASGGAWLAESDAAIVGFAALDVVTGTVWALFVDPDAEGAGVARALHGRMVEWARDRGMGRLSLNTERGTRAAGFYRRAGWTEVETTADGEPTFELALQAKATEASSHHKRDG